MSILPAQEIRKLCQIEDGLLYPFEERKLSKGMTYGLGPSGYDVRLNNAIVFNQKGNKKFALGVTFEHFKIPNDIIAFVKDKSTWARLGLSAFNTVIEPGWYGYLTLEFVYHHDEPFHITAGTPIVQVVFQYLYDKTEQPYNGKYQNQTSLGPTKAIMEK